MMDTEMLVDKFARIGARVKAADVSGLRLRSNATIALDVQHDRRGEYFEIASLGSESIDIEVLDVRPNDRHLLLLVREGNEKSKLLCGHDERHWFVAAIPETAPVGTVRQAKEALKPADVLRAQVRSHIREKDRNRRKNSAFMRQGEWFFVPVHGLTVDDKMVLRNEPLRRGNGGKPHWAEYCYRSGGEAVYVCQRHPNGMTTDQYAKVLAKHGDAREWGWTQMRRNPQVHVRGRIRHPDHKTITLRGWHRVVMNTEGQSRAMRNVAFLD